LIKEMNGRLIRTPRSVDICITRRCNLHCRYCSHFTSAGDTGSDLSKEEWLKFFKELNTCAVFNISLQGGEPFIREDIEDIISGIVENRMRFSVLSNGTLVTNEMASFLASTGRCDNVQVSIDGSMPLTHDVFRGQGTFHDAIRGVKQLQRYKIPVNVRVTVHRKNIHDLDAIANLLLNDIGLDNFSTNAASFMGLCRYNSDMIQLSAQERSIAMECLLRLNKEYAGRINATAGPLAEGMLWLEMEKARRLGRGRLPGKGYLTACGGPTDKIAIRSDGVMVPCIQMSHIELGRINQDDLRKVWQSHPELHRLRERCKTSLKDFEFCRGCDYINYCTGNCPALAYMIVGTDNHPSPDACLKKFLEDGGRLPSEDFI
jgi:SynChlorMet cassette radical SAM/SPASM protein ScmE